MTIEVKLGGDRCIFILSIIFTIIVYYIIYARHGSHAYEANHVENIEKFVWKPRSVAPLTADDTSSRFGRTSSYAPKSKLQLLTATAAKIRSDTDFRHIRRLIQHD